MRMTTEWTTARDEELKRLRAGGMTWDAIALAMRLGRNTVLERGRKIGARRVPSPPPLAAEAPDRAARQAGHPLTWDLINQGTVLEGCAYPYPVFI